MTACSSARTRSWRCSRRSGSTPGRCGAMPRKRVDVDAMIERVGALGPEYQAVAGLAKIGQAVVQAVRTAGGIPRERVRANGPAGKPRASRAKQPDLPGTAG